MGLGNTTSILQLQITMVYKSHNVFIFTDNHIISPQSMRWMVLYSIRLQTGCCVQELSVRTAQQCLWETNITANVGGVLFQRKVNDIIVTQGITGFLSLQTSQAPVQSGFRVVQGLREGDQRKVMMEAVFSISFCCDKAFGRGWVLV